MTYMKKIATVTAFILLSFAAWTVFGLTKSELMETLGQLELRLGVLELKIQQAENGSPLWNKLSLLEEWQVVNEEALGISAELQKLGVASPPRPAFPGSVDPSGGGVTTVSSDSGVVVPVPEPADGAVSSIGTRPKANPPPTPPSQVDVSSVTQGEDARRVAAADLYVGGIVFTGDPAIGGGIVAGEMKVTVIVQNSGAVSIGRNFTNAFQYSQNGRDWTDWVTFEMTKIATGDSAEARYTWKGNEGDWYFRFCADSNNTVFEANEYNNCADSARVHIVTAEGQSSSPELSSLGPQEDGEANLSLPPPLFSGQEVSGGKYRAGKMTLSETITNAGGARSDPIRGIWQYATGATFTDWMRVELPALDRGAAVASRYSWNGDHGMWRFRFCVEGASGSARKCSGAIFIEIIP